MMWTRGATSTAATVERCTASAASEGRAPAATRSSTCGANGVSASATAASLRSAERLLPYRHVATRSPMKLDAITMGVSMRGVPDLTRDVERAGFDGLWFTESGRTAYTGCAAAALTAEHLDIGTAVALAFPRSPMVTAAVAWE